MSPTVPPEHPRPEHPRPEYPPARHVLRDLDFEVEVVGPQRQVARYTPGPSGAVELGGVLTVVDLLAGSVCLRSVAPDWMATSTLMFHLTDEDLAAEPMILTADPLRVGRKVVTVAVAAADAETGTPLGEGVATFARLPRRDSNLSLADGAGAAVAGTSALGTSEGGSPVGGRSDRVSEGGDSIGGSGQRFSFPGAGTAVGAGGSFARSVGCSVLDASSGVIDTPVTGYVRNSFGAMNGGVVAGLVEVAAVEVVAHTRGSAARAHGVTIHYLAQGRSGPVRTCASVLRDGGSAGSTVRVEVVDTGAEGGERLMAVAYVSVVPVASG